MTSRKGEVCAGYAFPKHRRAAVLAYRAVYVIFVFIGSVAELSIVWKITDCFNVLMAVPNLIALIALSGVVVKTTREHFAKQKDTPEIEK